MLLVISRVANPPVTQLVSLPHNQLAALQANPRCNHPLYLLVNLLTNQLVCLLVILASSLQDNHLHNRQVNHRDNLASSHPVSRVSSLPVSHLPNRLSNHLDNPAVSQVSSLVASLLVSQRAGQLHSRVHFHCHLAITCRDMMATCLLASVNVFIQRQTCRISCGVGMNIADFSISMSVRLMVSETLHVFHHA